MEVLRIKKRLAVADPFGDWQFFVRPLKTGDFGLWAVYHGEMTPAERNRRILKREMMAERQRITREKNKLKRQLDPAATIRPNPNRR